MYTEQLFKTSGRKKALTRQTPRIIMRIFRVRWIWGSLAGAIPCETGMYEVTIGATFSVSDLYCISTTYNIMWIIAYYREYG